MQEICRPKQNTLQKGVDGVLFRCITKYEGSKIIDEVHEGTCIMHIATRSLAIKIKRSKVLLVNYVY